MKAKLISVFSSIGALIMGCLGGSCGILCLAGGCCGSYAFLGFLGLSGSTLGIFSKLTPLFLALTVLSLGFAFYQAYKPKPKPCCADEVNPENSCCNRSEKTSFIKSKAFLWIVTVMCIIMWTYPIIFNNQTESNPKSQCCPSGSDDEGNTSGIEPIKKTPPCCNQ